MNYYLKENFKATMQSHSNQASKLQFSQFYRTVTHPKPFESENVVPKLWMPSISVCCPWLALPKDALPGLKVSQTAVACSSLHVIIICSRARSANQMNVWHPDTNIDTTKTLQLRRPLWGRIPRMQSKQEPKTYICWPHQTNTASGALEW